MNSFVYLKITGYGKRFIRKCYDYNISLYNVDYLEGDDLVVKVSLKDYKKVKRLNYYSKVTIIRYDGLKGLKLHINKYIFTYIMILLSFALMDILTSYIIRVDIIHENSRLRELIKEELANEGIETFRLAKDFDKLEVIKNRIVDNNQEKLEWLSITRYGMTYVVRAEERIITKIEKEEGYAHLVSTKDALITNVNHTAGDAIVRSGDFVKKGDILVSGELKVYDQVKANTLATGEVYGNVWYTTDITFPLDFEERIYTGRRRFNFSINNRMFFRNKFQHFEQSRVRRIRILGITFAYYTEKEYELKTGKHTLKQAEELALEKVHEAMLKKINKNGQIIEKKVLKNEEINSTINMSVFIIVNQRISERLFYTPGSEEDDATYSN